VIRIISLLLLLILSAYLFDRYVDQRSKKLVLQTIVAGFTGILLITFFYLAWTSYHDRQLEKAVAVNFHSLEKLENQSIIAFEICNHRKPVLTQVKFLVVGFVANRSTPYNIIQTRLRAGEGTELKSDLMIEPDTCQVDQWQGAYLAFDRYEITTIAAEWEDDKRTIMRQ